jgi:hypothetical protein
MSLPSRLRVKISSESAEMSVTPVVLREMAADELVLQILGVTGKDAKRIGEILERGAFTSGASRFRWDGISVDEGMLREFLTRFPDSDPSRPFDPDRCVEIVLRGEGQRRTLIEVAAARRRRWFRRQSFWEVLLQAIPPAVYREYSYKDSADVYRSFPEPEQRRRIEESLSLLTFSLRFDGLKLIDFYVPRVSSLP